MDRPPPGPGRTATATRRTTTRPATARRDSRRPGERPAARRPREAVPRYWFADRILAVLTGRRPVHSMLNHTVGEAYEQLIQLTPVDEPFLVGREPAVRHCDEYAPREGVIEAFARITSGDRVHALAFRLEQGPDHRWRCAAVEVGHRPREAADA
ncbi:Rv3235 family protein [Streptomyces sp. NPDC058374]|uniref:Rv3235 family protein n=1 Tax=unclassified Streptomyces TaxID=2593676 RepID=UPI003667FB21